MGYTLEPQYEKEGENTHRLINEFGDFVSQSVVWKMGIHVHTAYIKIEP